MKRLTAAAAALIVAVCGAVSAYAEPEPIEPAETGESAVTTAHQEQPAETSVVTTVTEAPVTQATQTTPAVTTPAQQTQQTQPQTSAQTTASQTTTTTEASVGRKIEPTKVFLTIGEIKDDEFEVTLNIVPDQLITTAVIKIEYDSSLMELSGSIINSKEIGGQPTEENKDSVYTFSYLNPKGTQYSGVYSTMRFKITDKKMTESVIYVSVDKLEDNDLLDVPNNIQNGIVKYQEEPAKDESSVVESEKEDESSQELPVLNVKMGTLPMMLDELGIPDAKNVKSVKIIDTGLAVYEQSALTLLASGETEMVVKYNSGKELRFRLVIAKADPVSSAAEPVSSELPEQDTSGRTFMIAMAILAAIAAIAIEYILIMKPFGRKSAEEDDDEDEFEEYDEDDDTEMVQDPEEVFARKKRPENKNRNGRPAAGNQERRPESREPGSRPKGREPGSRPKGRK